MPRWVAQAMISLHSRYRRLAVVTLSRATPDNVGNPSGWALDRRGGGLYRLPFLISRALLEVPQGGPM